MGRGAHLFNEPCAPGVEDVEEVPHQLLLFEAAECRDHLLDNELVYTLVAKKVKQPCTSTNSPKFIDPSFVDSVQDQ